VTVRPNMTGRVLLVFFLVSAFLWGLISFSPRWLVGLRQVHSSSPPPSSPLIAGTFLCSPLPLQPPRARSEVEAAERISQTLLSAAVGREIIYYIFFIPQMSSGFRQIKSALF
jgi:hypothetical protein